MPSREFLNTTRLQRNLHYNSVHIHAMLNDRFHWRKEQKLSTSNLDAYITVIILQTIRVGKSPRARLLSVNLSMSAQEVHFFPPKKIDFWQTTLSGSDSNSYDLVGSCFEWESCVHEYYTVCSLYCMRPVALIKGMVFSPSPIWCVSCVLNYGLRSSICYLC